MITVRDLVANKGGTIWSVTPETTTLEALRMLTEKRVGALLVLDDGLICGIVSERDFVHQMATGGDCELQRPVSETMTTRVIFVLPEQTIEACMAIMTDYRIRHLPVLEDGHLIGLISIGDVVKALVGAHAPAAAAFLNEM